MDPFIGEIRAVGFNYAPRGWAFCDGATLQIRSNTALFAILGTTYGGDGQSTFRLPDLRGRIVVHAGQGPGLSRYPLGSVSGTENVILALPQLAAHTHGLGTDIAVSANNAAGSGTTPTGNVPAVNSGVQQYSPSADTAMAAGSVGGTAANVGGGQAHSNMMPYLTLNYIIATTGIFPPRS
jgi:microcystin-dependent protein